jgi:hypothetical protein
MGRTALVTRPIPSYAIGTSTATLDFDKFRAPVKFGPNVSETDKRKNRNRAKAQRAARRKNRAK